LLAWVSKAIAAHLWQAGGAAVVARHVVAIVARFSSNLIYHAIAAKFPGVAVCTAAVSGNLIAVVANLIRFGVCDTITTYFCGIAEGVASITGYLVVVVTHFSQVLVDRSVSTELGFARAAAAVA
jgi:uncharacterized membrane protein YagU involved in acid resistance